MATVATTVVIFVLMRTVVSTWAEVEGESNSGRIATRHKVSFVMTIPSRYADSIRELPGVRAVTNASWFGGKDPAHPREFFATVAISPADFLEVYDDVELPLEQKEQFLEDRQACLIGRNLARRLNWSIGDTIRLKGTIYPGTWEFRVAGIYDADRKSTDLSTLWFHYDYLNESLPEGYKDQVGWTVARLEPNVQPATMARAIDAHFSSSDVQTSTMSERALNASFLGMLSAVLGALDLFSAIILVICTLVIGNTMAMGTRERTGEYAVLRATGFTSRHITLLIVGEAALLAILGTSLGLLVAFPFVEGVTARFLADTMGSLFPALEITWQTTITALLAALLLAGLATITPVTRIQKMNVTAALRH